MGLLYSEILPSSERQEGESRRLLANDSRKFCRFFMPLGHHYIKRKKHKKGFAKIDSLNSFAAQACKN